MLLPGCCSDLVSVVDENNFEFVAIQQDGPAGDFLRVKIGKTENGVETSEELTSSCGCTLAPFTTGTAKEYYMDIEVCVAKCALALLLLYTFVVDRSHFQVAEPY